MLTITFLLFKYVLDILWCFSAIIAKLSS